MTATSPRTSPTPLTAFNSLALRCQDEVYTLAYYLLGDEPRAAEVTQAAFARLYQGGQVGLEAFRREALRGVLGLCRGRRAPFTASRDALCRALLELECPQRAVAVLVDVLGLGYAESAALLGVSTGQAAHLLAQARLNLSRARM